MTLQLGQALHRLRMRELTGLVAVVVALVLTGAPALGGTDQVIAPPEQTDQPAPPGEDADEVTPDAVLCVRATTARPDPAAGRRGERPAATPGPVHAPLPHVRQSVAAPSAHGSGVRLRC